MLRFRKSQYLRCKIVKTKIDIFTKKILLVLLAKIAVLLSNLGDIVPHCALNNSHVLSSFLPFSSTTLHLQCFFLIIHYYFSDTVRIMDDKLQVQKASQACGSPPILIKWIYSNQRYKLIPTSHASTNDGKQH